ncbi:hypothetical protein GCM10027598_60050 [Amycolatopsis oliviviridis]|uniref:SnoaL-like domain-containing protein n=1 Tax=Amycolatopsis oliviviridis TaxID=1471590 RepID=A0ABQ3MCZ7_9PSEU|nr:nuclear transport factor 2 family protein [Amycolatopsis oliviviridis]GHH38290.1 hypothetical protein GCM10017790_83830 [Amycolatopsis oliviviridis]
MSNAVNTDTYLTRLDKFITRMNAHDIPGVIELYTEDCVLDDLGADSVVRGHEELFEFLTGMFTAAPGMTGKLVAACEDVDRVWVEWGWHGVGPDPEKVHRIVSVMRYEDGRIKHATDFWRGVGAESSQS